MEDLPRFHVDQGETREQIVFGGSRATSFIKKVVAGEYIDGKKYQFNSEFVMELFNRVYMVPRVKGDFRQSDSTTVGGEAVCSHVELPFKMRLYGRWLHEQMEWLKNHPEDIVGALAIAAAAHYGLTMPRFHPFDNGNGRTARALVNTILMSQTYELTAHHIAIPPIPIIRSSSLDDDRYIKVLRQVDQTKILNPFMVFLAQQWVKNLKERLTEIYSKIGSPKSVGDKKLVEKLEKRVELLRDFVEKGQTNNSQVTGLNGSKKTNHPIYPVPDYFEPQYVKVEHA